MYHFLRKNETVWKNKRETGEEGKGDLEEDKGEVGVDLVEVGRGDAGAADALCDEGVRRGNASEAF